MKFKANALLTALTLGAAFGVQAAPVLLGSIDHLYGAGPGRAAESIMSVFHPGGNCDTLNAASVTVRATSAASCNRFADIFDFSSLNFDSIDHFDVTLSFSGARDSFESWSIRGASNYIQTAASFGTLGASGPQTFTFSSAQGLFSSIVSAETFVLSFAQNGFAGNSSNFSLSAARVDVYGVAAAPGEALPEPASLALVGLSLAALGAVRRTRKTVDVA